MQPDETFTQRQLMVSDAIAGFAEARSIHAYRPGRYIYRWLARALNDTEGFIVVDWAPEQRLPDERAGTLVATVGRELWEITYSNVSEEERRNDMRATLLAVPLADVLQIRLTATADLWTSDHVEAHSVELALRGERVVKLPGERLYGGGRYYVAELRALLQMGQ